MVASVLVGQAFVRRRRSAGIRWAGLLLLLALPLGVLLLIVGGALSPDTDLGFWSALTVPYALARVLLAVFARPGAMPSMPVGTPGSTYRLPFTTRPRSAPHRIMARPSGARWAR
jgi:hypothetical protein